MLALIWRVMAIMARAISFFGSGKPLPRGAAWQYSQPTLSACEMACMFAMTSGPGWALAQERAAAARRSGFIGNQYTERVRLNTVHSKRRHPLASRLRPYGPVCWTVGLLSTLIVAMLLSTA